MTAPAYPIEVEVIHRTSGVREKRTAVSATRDTVTIAWPLNGSIRFSLKTGKGERNKAPSWSLTSESLELVWAIGAPRPSRAIINPPPGSTIP